MAVQIGATVSDAKVFRLRDRRQGRARRTSTRAARTTTSRRAVTPSSGRRRAARTRSPGRTRTSTSSNEVFVETVGGDLTIKVENNTKDGQGHLPRARRRPEPDARRRRDRLRARRRGLILLKIKPFREQKYALPRLQPAHARRAARRRASGVACVELPEDHGIDLPRRLLPADRRATSSSTATREDSSSSAPSARRTARTSSTSSTARERRRVPALAVQPDRARRSQNPIRCHGYSLFADGTMVVFRADGRADARPPDADLADAVHDRRARRRRADATARYLAKVGNADLVRGISELLSIAAGRERRSRRAAPSRTSSRPRAAPSTRTTGSATPRRATCSRRCASCSKTAELILDEFEKVAGARAQARARRSATAEDAASRAARARAPGRAARRSRRT